MAASSVATAGHSGMGGILPGPINTPLVQPGTWTFSMHGNCPHCHHHHTAVQVDLNITSDPGHANYVDCERCNRQWLVFSHDNSTRISLLSATTTEPDAIEEEFRQHLIGIVRRATTWSNMSDYDEGSEVGGMRPGADQYTLRTNTGLTSIPEDSVPLTRSRSQKLLKRVRKTRDTHLPTLRRSNIGKLFGRAGPSNSSARQQRESVAPVLTTADNNVRVANQSFLPGNDNAGVGSTQTDPSHARRANRDTNARNMAELLPGLDTSTLQGMSRQERQNWARRQFTGFQRRNRAPRLGLSPIQSVQSAQYRRQLRPQSVDVAFAGGIAEVAHMIIPHAFSLGLIDPQSLESFDASSVYSPLLSPIQIRPMSLPNLINHSPQLRHLQDARVLYESLSYASNTQSRHSSMAAPSYQSSQATTVGSDSEPVGERDLFYEAVETEQTAVVEDADPPSAAESRSSEDTLRDLVQPPGSHN